MEESADVMDHKHDPLPDSRCGKETGTAYEDLILSQGPSLYWRLGEESGPVATDRSGNDNHGEYVGGVTHARPGALAADRDRAIRLDGSSGAVTSSYDPFAAGAACSLSVWARLLSKHGDHALFGGATGRARWVRHANLSMAIEWSSVASFPDAIPALDRWFQAVFVLDPHSGTLDLYIDGAPFGHAGGITQRWAGVGGFQVGGLGPAPRSNPWVGSIDEVAVWERALSAAEVADQYAAATSRRLPRHAPQGSGSYFEAVMATGPQLYWRLDEESTGQSLADASGNDNEGFVGDGVGHAHASPGRPGAVDGNASLGFSDPATGGPDVRGATVYARAYDFAPFKPGAAVTVSGFARNSARSFGIPFETPFETLFASGGGLDGTNGNCTLEARNQGEIATVRWYSNVRNELTRPFNCTDFRDAWPIDGTEWVHWLFSYEHDGAGARLWINGRERARTYQGRGSPRDFLGTEGYFQIANRGDGAYEVWNGELDEIVVWRRLLADREIESICAAAELQRRR